MWCTHNVVNCSEPQNHHAYTAWENIIVAWESDNTRSYEKNSVVSRFLRDSGLLISLFLSITNKLQRCILLVMLKNTLMMHGPIHLKLRSCCHSLNMPLRHNLKCNIIL